MGADDDEIGDAMEKLPRPLDRGAVRESIHNRAWTAWLDVLEGISKPPF